MKRLVIVLLLILVCHSLIKAQENAKIEAPDSINITPKGKDIDISQPIVKCIWKSIDQNLLQQVPKDFAHLMVLGISINDQGQIAEVYRSKKEPREDLLKLLSPINEFDQKIKQIPFRFKGYENKILIFPVILYRNDDDQTISIRNILSDIVSMWPTLPADNVKQIVLLEPRYITYYPKRTK
ncbi:hypothetical protein CPT03_09705 [Pedobacter ginsengisoli]|uniref:TonB C-terminal domain-containing protein n=1 Tax=Pedobacter ginsengisoli TaxID=363852 RepID=A0A2D1U544_9SPHI|nr:hypothetical protein [Pedobacter ginsengisoli]ATP56729.1 hypothetical protein CPT03_09705 [Pedobacter ginsengisoli]